MVLLSGGIVEQAPLFQGYWCVHRTGSSGIAGLFNQSERSDKMTKMIKLVAVLVVVFAAQSAMAAVDFSGYLRSGSGSSSNGGKVDCFGAKGGVALAAGDIANAGRLGQECGTYGELQFGTTMGEVNGTKFDIQTMMATGVDQLQDWEDANFAFRQAYGRATGFGTGAFAKADVWVGKRYYDRHDIHIVDFFWMADTGPGAGIENVDLGVGKFSYALMRAGPSTSATLAQHDFRLQGINLGSAGSLSIGTIIVRGNNTDAANATIDAAGQKKNGISAWASHSIVFGSVQNNLVFQISNGAANLGGDNQRYGNLRVKNDQWRLIDSVNFEYGDHVNGAAFLGYGKADQIATLGGADTKTTDTSFVVRPVYHFDDIFSLAVEAGTTRYATNGAPTNHLNKLTIAPQISMGSGFYARPVLRAYYTMASWNAGGANDNNGLITATDTSGRSYGFQMEAWW
jgi:maltoporin